MKMPKIKIGEREMYSDDMNEEQKKIFNEVMYCREIKERLSYQVETMEMREAGLAQMILDAEDEKATDEEKTS